MSDEQQKKQQEQPDTSEPSDERKAVLEAAYDQQEGTDAPYKGIKITTLGEVQWIMQQRQWTDEWDSSQPGGIPKSMARANLSDADLGWANLSGANFREAKLSGAALRGANLSGADLRYANLNGADLIEANLSGAALRGANLSGANLRGANLSGANLGWANLSGANLGWANLSGANLGWANLSGANLREANLSGADLSCVTFDNTSYLGKITLSDRTMRLVDVTWGGANLVSVDWEPLTIVRDEIAARKPKDHKPKPQMTRRDEWKSAVRAYRLLATALRDQGMNEEADRFAYRARVCQQQVFRFQKKRGSAFWNRFLDIIAGYGYRPERTIIAYISILMAFAFLFWAVSVFWVTTPTTQHLSWYESIFLSISSFHGRGFFPTGISTGDPLAGVAIFEAVMGLFIEVSFIATFTQRYFGK
jgi:uncharacterized protein YjbI with pentapeptide repeats